MRYIFIAAYRKSSKAADPAHIGLLSPPHGKYFPFCGRMMAGNVTDSQWVPRDRQLCSGCSALYAKEFGKPPPWEFKK